MKNTIIIDEMFVLMAELQGDIYSMQNNPTYEEQTVGIQVLEEISDTLYSELTTHPVNATTFQLDVWVAVTKDLIEILESLITEIDEFYFLYTHISQLHTKINQLK